MPRKQVVFPRCNSQKRFSRSTCPQTDQNNTADCTQCRWSFWEQTKITTSIELRRNHYARESCGLKCNCEFLKVKWSFSSWRWIVGVGSGCRSSFAWKSLVDGNWCQLKFTTNKSTVKIIVSQVKYIHCKYSPTEITKLHCFLPFPTHIMDMHFPVRLSAVFGAIDHLVAL